MTDARTALYLPASPARPLAPGSAPIRRHRRLADLVPIALLLSVSSSALPVRAATPPPSLSVRSLPEWWAAPGLPGFAADAHMGNGSPLSYLGLVAGGVALHDGLLPGTSPWPGVEECRVPLAWYDSSAVVVGEDAGWLGFSAALVQLRTYATPRTEGKPRAAFTWMSGSSGLDRNGLMLQRGSADGWLRGGAVEGSREGTGLLGRAGQHAWFLDFGRRRGPHVLSAAFAQRGAANATRRVVDPDDLSPFLAPWAGFEEAARGESGALAWEWARDGRGLAATLRRSHDHRESFQSPTSDTLFEFSEREAQLNTLELEASSGAAGRTQGLRLELTQGQVERGGDFFNSALPTDARQRSAWIAARMVRPLRSTALELQLGAGYVSSPSVRSQRLQAAPSAVLRWQRDRRWLRLHAGRLVTPVWSDLAFGVRPFVQDCWTVGADAGAGDPARNWVAFGLLGSSSGQRALLQRWPVRELSLRYGWTPEAARVGDAQVTVAAGLHRGGFGLDGSGFARVRPLGGQTSQPDPAVGARAGVEAGFRAFAGDLGVTLRLEGAWVGARDNESLPDYFVWPRPLAGYATLDGSLAVTLGDAHLVLRAHNLEDQPHPQNWTDVSSEFPGTPALGSGRQYRLEVAWPFFN